jgi:arabinogalactan oligomer/maltooligosaccharide transport system substrate-binding protein
MGVQIIAFNNYSKKQNEAIQFAKFLTSHENMLNFALKTSRVASRKSVINSSEIKNDEIISGWSQQAVYGEPMPNIPEMSVVWTAWKDSLPIMYSGRQPIQATLDELVNVLSRRLDLMKQ